MTVTLLFRNQFYYFYYYFYFLHFSPMSWGTSAILFALVVFSFFHRLLLQSAFTFNAKMFLQSDSVDSQGISIILIWNFYELPLKVVEHNKSIHPFSIDCVCGRNKRRRFCSTKSNQCNWILNRYKKRNGWNWCLSLSTSHKYFRMKCVVLVVICFIFNNRFSLIMTIFPWFVPKNWWQNSIKALNR